MFRADGPCGGDGIFRVGGGGWGTDGDFGDGGRKVEGGGVGGKAPGRLEVVSGFHWGFYWGPENEVAFGGVGEGWGDVRDGDVMGAGRVGVAFDDHAGGEDSGGSAFRGKLLT